MEAYEQILLAVMIFAAAAQIEIGNANAHRAVAYIAPPEIGWADLPCASTAAEIDMSCVALLQN